MDDAQRGVGRVGVVEPVPLQYDPGARRQSDGIFPLHTGLLQAVPGTQEQIVPDLQLGSEGEERIAVIREIGVREQDQGQRGRVPADGKRLPAGPPAASP